MTDFDAGPPPRSAAGRRRTAEFYTYFALIFVLALPAALVRWTRDVGRYRTLNLEGPLARAWIEASITTPRIFSL